MAWLKRPTKKLVIAWIFGLLLFVLAVPSWRSFVVGLPFIFLGEVLRLWACGYLEKNQKLTTSGPYSHVQNPLYLGTLLILLGFTLQARNPYLLAAGLLIFFLYYVPFKKRREGDRLRALFGEAYDHYASNVPPLLFRLRSYERRSLESFRWGLIIENSEHATAIVVTIGVALMVVRMLVPIPGIGIIG